MMVPPLVLVTVPMLTGDAKLPDAFESCAVNTLAEGVFGKLHEFWIVYVIVMAAP